MDKEKALIKKAHLAMTKQAERVKSLEEERESLLAKIARYERKETAEEIANMKIAASALAPEDFQDEVTRLMDSEDDLAYVKTAMRYMGPAAVRTDHSLVEGGEAEGGTTKSASADEARKAHIKQAEAELAKMMEALDGVD